MISHRTPDGIDCSLGELGCECSAATASIQHPAAGLWQLAEQQTVVIGVVIPVEHSQKLQPSSLASRPVEAIFSTALFPRIGSTERSA